MRRVSSHIGSQLSTEADEDDWVPHTLSADMSLLREKGSEKMLPFGRRRKLVAMLMFGGLVIGASVELFVRFVLDPTFDREQGWSTNMYSNTRQMLGDTQRPLWSFTGRGVTSGLSDQAFKEWEVLACWVVCVVTGLGSEFFVGYEFLTTVKVVSRKHEHAWFVAQFVFSLVILTSILLARQGNALALIFGVAGAWKFGFPETLLSIIGGWQSPSIAGKLSGLLNGFGTMAHHSALLLFISIFTLEVSPLTRPLVTGAMPLVAQHVVISVKYVSPVAYIIAELILEIWWEIEVFSVIEFSYLPHGVQEAPFQSSPMYSGLVVRCVCTMLLAHWMYWSAGILGFLAPTRPTPESEECVDLEWSAKSGFTPPRAPAAASGWQGNELSEWRHQLAEYHPDTDPTTSLDA